MLQKSGVYSEDTSSYSTYSKEKKCFFLNRKPERTKRPGHILVQKKSFLVFLLFVFLKEEPLKNIDLMKYIFSELKNA